MIVILRFVVLPAAIILSVPWFLVLKHRRPTLVPFLGVIAAMLLAVRLTGLSPLGFFVSFGGYVWFAVLAWIAAVLVHAITRASSALPVLVRSPYSRYYGAAARRAYKQWDQGIPGADQSRNE